MPRVLVTGASGFVGRHVVADLVARGWQVRAAVRQPPAVPWPAGVETAGLGDLREPQDWAGLVSGIDHVVHLAGLAHADHDVAEDTYRSVNTQATRDLARAAAAAGVRRFVFMSSIRAQSGFASPVPLTEADEPCPTDAYGRSKLAAELAVAETGLDWVILRPVLVYGAGVKANMAALLRLARLPMPLPLAALEAGRSVLARENLCGAVAFALSDHCPARQTYIVSDPEPLTVPDMIAAMRKGLGRRAGLLNLPPAALALAARLIGRAGQWEKLSAGLIARPTKLMSAGWRPSVTTQQALAQLAADRGDV